MLARRDQENLVHSHQVTAATKPLNQGVRQLQPKTPSNRAPKTPFKIPLRDENEPVVFGKNTVKGNGGGAGVGKEAFVTPLGPRNRAPLGAKTTNAKAAGFKTPGLQPETLKTQKTKRRGSSTKKPKKVEIEVHQAQPEALNASEVDDVPDIEYAPPKPKELPDDPEDITYDTTYPQFQGRNIALGWGKIYYDGEVGEDGLTARQRKFQQDSVTYEKMVDETIQKQVDDIKLEDLLYPDEPDMFFHQAVSKQPPRKKTTLPDGANTLKSRNAVAALSRPGSAARVRSDTAKGPSTTVKSKNLSSLLPARRNTPTPPASVSTARHAAAAASSRTTVGYSKGRTVSSTLQNKKAPARTNATQQKAIIAPETYIQLYGTPPIDSEMWVRCKDAGCLPEPEGVPGYDDDAAVPSLFEEDEETRNFQLTL